MGYTEDLRNAVKAYLVAHGQSLIDYGRGAETVEVARRRELLALLVTD